MSEANKELVRRYYAEAMGDLSGIEQIVSATFVDHHFPPGLPAGPAGVRQFFKTIIAGAFSDLEIQHEFMLAEGNKVDCHFVVVAKHTGEFGDIKPKGNIIRLPAISTFRVENGKLAEAWEIFDSGNLLEQMRRGSEAREFYDASGKFNEETAKAAYLDFLQQSGYPVNDAIREKLWVSDFNLGRFTEVGLGGIIWWGDEKHNFTGLDAFLLPGQIIPEHWHVKAGNIPEKMEAWLVRQGEVYAYAEGEPTPNRRAKIGNGDAVNMTAKSERVLRVGEIAGISRPLEKHWMQAGPQGAIFTEFSTFHTGAAVKFTDPQIRF